MSRSGAVSRRPGAARVVTPLELFFDLVYVFAIGQLSHHLLAHVDLRTGAETVVLGLAVVYAWYMTAWGTNWLEPERPPVRLLLVGMMFASLLMSGAIADAFDGRAWLFVTGYLLLQFGRTTFLMVALRGRPLGGHFVNVAVWELLLGVLLAAGAAVGGDARLALWGVAVLGLHAGAWSLHWLPGPGRRIDLGHTEIAGPHLIERFRLFFLIALGETVLTTGRAFSDAPFTVARLLALVAGFTGSVALWWCYFRRVERIGVEAAETAEDAGVVGWRGTWTLTLAVLALIGVAVGDELAIAHPDDVGTPGFVVLAFGGPALFLVAQFFFLRDAPGNGPRSRLLGVVALMLLAVATAPLPRLAGTTASTLVLVAVAASDSLGRRDPERSHLAR
ncbi:low temperature requirement protein A [Micromonospora sediminicola]|uniref:low temperature requirement protein A n=1 Tax=Micromonospora sediminicola TaxID=946078 RepID=UPI0033C04542